MRMNMKRFSRLTNAHSKKLINHRHALSLYFCFYNWTASTRRCALRLQWPQG